MGGWVSHLWWGGDPDNMNQISGLTMRDVYAVQKSWTRARANPVATGIELFTRLFHANPKTKVFFKMIRNLPEYQYSQNHQFKAHVINLMSSLSSAVDNLNQPEVVAVMMNKLGESHGRRKVEEKHFNDLKGVIMKMFIEVLKLDEETLVAWGKTVDFLYKHIFETLQLDETR
ncbi:uncharacterized protein LOC126770840 [Nymphalis io]|uniref:uncharacterized protein LOC126770840 n=1 Tax=Inachis io TaxID=171585 RepID=UPI00216A73EA|nr:uncharacterized protein LOC126770840 [Nymphalis io]XP_050346397.1 uncharacterized protein LOC126770840 [Nymphalis io]